MDFHAAIQTVRWARKLTQDQLCQQAGITVTFLRQVECGRKRPSPATMVTLAYVLHVPVSYLYLLADTSRDALVVDAQRRIRAVLACEEEG